MLPFAFGFSIALSVDPFLALLEWEIGLLSVFEFELPEDFGSPSIHRLQCTSLSGRDPGTMGALYPILPHRSTVRLRYCPRCFPKTSTMGEELFVEGWHRDPKVEVRWWAAGLAPGCWRQTCATFCRTGWCFKHARVWSKTMPSVDKKPRAKGRPGSDGGKAEDNG